MEENAITFRCSVVIELVMVKFIGSLDFGHPSSYKDENDDDAAIASGWVLGSGSVLIIQQEQHNILVNVAIMQQCRFGGVIRQFILLLFYSTNK